MMVQRNIKMNMAAINAMKKNGQQVNQIERKVAKHAVQQVPRNFEEDLEKEIERVMAESKA